MHWFIKRHLSRQPIPRRYTKRYKNVTKKLQHEQYLKPTCSIFSKNTLWFGAVCEVNSVKQIKSFVEERFIPSLNIPITLLGNLRLEHLERIMGLFVWIYYHIHHRQNPYSHHVGQFGVQCLYLYIFLYIYIAILKCLHITLAVCLLGTFMLKFDYILIMQLFHKYFKGVILYWLTLLNK